MNPNVVHAEYERAVQGKLTVFKHDRVQNELQDYVEKLDQRRENKQQVK